MADRKESVREVAKAVRSHAKRSAQSVVRHPQYARVLTTDPLEVELVESKHILEEEDLVLSQWVSRYDTDHTIDPGDTALVQPMRNGDWLVTDIVSEKAV